MNDKWLNLSAQINSKNAEHECYGVEPEVLELAKMLLNNFKKSSENCKEVSLKWAERILKREQQEPDFFIEHIVSFKRGGICGRYLVFKDARKLKDIRKRYENNQRNNVCTTDTANKG